MSSGCRTPTSPPSTTSTTSPPRNGSPPPPPAPLAVALRLAPGPLVGSQSGVLLLPVEVDVRGPASRLGDSLLWAEPEPQETLLTGRTRFDADATGRVVVLLQPDCSLLAPSQGHRVVATLELELVGPAQQRARAVLDLGGEPTVSARVAALCAPSSTVPTSADAAASLPASDASLAPRHPDRGAGFGRTLRFTIR